MKLQSILHFDCCYFIMFFRYTYIYLYILTNYKKKKKLKINIDIIAIEKNNYLYYCIKKKKIDGD